MRHVWQRRALAVAYGLAGAVVAVALFGNVKARVGPFDTTLSARPALHGSTLIRLAPLGTIRLDTHDGPVRVDARVDELRMEAAEAIARNPAVLAGLEDDLAADARHALSALARRVAFVAVLGAATAALALTWRPRSLVPGAAAGTVLVLAAGSVTVATWRPHAITEPHYTGLLTVAPRAVGDARSLVNRFDRYRAQLAELVGNAASLYRAAQGLPAMDPGDGTIRLLHVSDIHLNPQAFDLIRLLSEEFHVDAVVDTGDLTDWGTEPESRLVEEIGRLRVPYVWVRGNHDSLVTQLAVAAQPNAVVLDGTAATVAGLRVFGVGDPRYTPDKGQPTGKVVERDEAARLAPKVASMLRAAGGADVLLVHDPRMAARAGGLAPLILAGHTHSVRRDRLGTSTLLVEGSTGGAGLRALQGAYPEPLTASVLYLDPGTHRLVGYDQVTVQGLGDRDVRIERHAVTPRGPASRTTTSPPSTTPTAGGPAAPPQ